MPCFQAIATGVYSSITGEFICILNKGKDYGFKRAFNKSMFRAFKKSNY